MSGRKVPAVTVEASPDFAIFQAAADLAGYDRLWFNADDVDDAAAREKYSALMRDRRDFIANAQPRTIAGAVAMLRLMADCSGDAFDYLSKPLLEGVLNFLGEALYDKRLRGWSLGSGK